MAERKNPSGKAKAPSLTPPSPAGTSEGPIEPEPAAAPEPESELRKGFPIVGIGASAGGLAAFESFFSAMPPEIDTGMAFVLVQHLAPDHKSILRDLVKRYTRMQVYEVEDGMAVQPDCAYIIPPNRDMAFLDGSLQLLEPSAPRGLRMPIDFFFRSLARDQHERAICIVFSGTGSDGTLGVRAVKGEGGMVMAQDPDSTEHDGMPRSAIATGLVDYVLPPAEMPSQLVTYVSHAFGKKAARLSPPVPKAENAVKKLCLVLRDRTGHDFSQYKENTVVRRVERRMALHQIERAEDYLRYVEQQPGEIEALFRDLLIGVTSFFRDAEAFSALEARVLPRLFAGKAPGGVVRVWVCGCSTGEEAYSIAILLQEQVQALKQNFKVQVFATDIDRQAIEQARRGVFPASIAADIPPARLARFFAQEPDGSAYRIQKLIRDLVVFSEQDVIKDPPFSKLDLISCRNLLIYMDGNLQKKLIPLFHYALQSDGVLFLGTSESVGEYTALFEAVDRKWKIYRRREDLSGAARPALGEIIPPMREGEAQLRPSRSEGRANLLDVTQQALLAHYAPAAVLVNGRGEILHISGRTGQYLEPAEGDAAVNLLPMAREGLRRDLTTALHRAVARREPVRCPRIRIRVNGETITANLTVRPAGPAAGAPPDVYLVLLEEVPPGDLAPAEETAAGVADHGGRIAALEQELRAKEEYLQTTLEEMETSNEEMKSTNEEMQSVNEELQSTNEELETSKEELQSVNEELATVNAELQAKVADLSRANNDMNNLLAGTGVGTLFVDMQLRIARFTPAVTQVFNLIPSDIGRPVAHTVSNLVDFDRLVEDIMTVMDTLAPQEAEVRTKTDAWYLMRIRPYRTQENVIEGAVLTFVDITEIKRAEAVKRESERFIAMIHQAIAAVGQVDPEGRFVYVNDHFSKLFGYTRTELLGMGILDLAHPDDRPDDRARYRALAGGGPDFRFEKRCLRKDGSALWVENRVSGIRDAEGRVQSMVTVLIDITKWKRMEEELVAVRKPRAADLVAGARSGSAPRHGAEGDAGSP